METKFANFEFRKGERLSHQVCEYPIPQLSNFGLSWYFEALRKAWGRGERGGYNWGVMIVLVPEGPLVQEGNKDCSAGAWMPDG